MVIQGQMWELILIVDDDYDVASLIKISLETDGFSAPCFTDPIAALEELIAFWWLWPCDFRC